MPDRLTFDQLLEFLDSRMRVSHVYQPLLIKALLDAGGKATVRQIALSFVGQDEPQVQYYEKRAKEMPIPVLKRHTVIAEEGDVVSLNVRRLTFPQQAAIRKACELRLHSRAAHERLLPGAANPRELPRSAG